VHILAGGLAATFVLTLAVEHFLKKQRSEFVAEMLEWLHKVLLGLDVAIALLLIVGIGLRVAGIRRPNAPISRIARDKEISRHIVQWVTQAGGGTKANHVRFCTEDCKDEVRVFPEFEASHS
jgi:hypothetical protein